MKNIRMMVIGFTALLLVAAIGVPGDKHFENTNLDKDSYFTVNDGGVQTSIMKIVGATSTLELGGIPIAQELVLPGTVTMYAGITLPAGYTWGNGVAISRAGANARLFTTICPSGVAGVNCPYGAGDGSTTFNPPDCRGRVLAGQDDGGTSSANRLTAPINGDTLGAAGGDEDVDGTIGGSQSIAHTHTISNHAHTMAHTHDEGSFTTQLTWSGVSMKVNWQNTAGWNSTHSISGTGGLAAGAEGAWTEGIKVNGSSGPVSTANTGNPTSNPASGAMSANATVNGSNFSFTQDANKNIQPTIIMNCIVKL